MGNSLACFSPPPTTTKTKATSKASSKELFPPWLSPLSANKKSRKLQSSPSSSEVVIDDSYIKQQAQIATMLYHHHLHNSGGDDLLIHLERSMSTNKNPPSSYKKSKKLSTKSRSLSCSTSVSALQLHNQDVARSDDEPESKHFVLVHGGGFGAWCWYKMISFLKEAKYTVDAIDLTGSGANFCDINSIKSLAEYARPLTHFLANLTHNKEVILVGHDLGGACISYAMEMYPNKVSKAIFVAAIMLTNGQRALDVFSQQSCLSDINQCAHKLVYANGKNHQPSAIDFDKSMLGDFLFNRTPSKDIALASVSMRAVPFAPVTEKLSLSASNYGSISRFYVKTDDDLAIPPSLQEAMVQSSPPKQVFQLKNSDHSPFFSRPQALYRLLTEISNLRYI